MNCLLVLFSVEFDWPKDKFQFYAIIMNNVLLYLYKMSVVGGGGGGGGGARRGVGDTHLLKTPSLA